MGRSVLVTGFEPFGGLSANPALEAVRLVPEQVGACAVHKLAVPVEYGRCVGHVMAEVERLRPRAVLLVGQARGRCALNVERVALNVDDAAAADNAGEVRSGGEVVPGGPVGRWSTLPVRDLVEACRASGIPCEVSNTAGTYVCNHLMYGVLDALEKGGVPTPAGFVHVPLMHGQVVEDGLRGEPSMSLGDIAAGLTAMVEVLAAQAG